MLGKPTGRDLKAREQRELKEYRASERHVPDPAKSSIASDLEADMGALQLYNDESDEEEIDPGLLRIAEDARNVRKICVNPACLNVKMKKGADVADAPEVKMMVCSRCKVATYCSVCGVVAWLCRMAESKSCGAGRVPDGGLEAPQTRAMCAIP